MEIAEAIQAIQQPRSRFQLENFVLGQHDTIEMQFYQLVLELQSLMNAYEMSEIGVRKMELKIKRLLETGDEMDALEAEEITLGLEQQKVVMTQRRNRIRDIDAEIAAIEKRREAMRAEKKGRSGEYRDTTKELELLNREKV